MIRQPADASAGSPIDFVSAAGTVRVPQNLISGYDFTLIGFGVITDLSGLPKAITYTIRVMLRRVLIVMMKQSRCLRSCPDRKELNY
jgi:hypothetical protein